MKGRLAAAVLLAGGLACKTADSVTSVPVYYIQIPTASLALIVGETRQLLVSAFDASGNPLSGRPATWGSNNNAVATVSPDGMVSAVGPGATVIVAAIEGKTAQVAVQVSLPSQRLTVTTAGTGNGSVSSSPAAIACTRSQGSESGTCAAQITEGTAVTLTAQGAGTHLFTGWSGDCSGTGLCQVTMSAARSVTATFHPPFGSLVVTVSGLPAGATGNVTVSRSGFPAVPAQSGVAIGGLGIGSWTVTAAQVSHGGQVYVAQPATQAVTITAGGTTQATVTYGRSTLNLTVYSAYITQAVQTMERTVTLVAGRDAYLRVFVIANQTNAERPRVRAKLWHGNTEVWGSFISANATGVVQEANEGSLASSWNIPIPGNLIQPGLRLWVDVDPDGTVAESNESDNEYPLNGSPVTIPVTHVPLIHWTFLRVAWGIPNFPHGPAGDLDGGNYESYILDARRLLPLHDWGASIRNGIFSGGSGPLQSDGGNWSALLNALGALKITEWWNANSYYVGAVKLDYTQGTNGIGYVPGSPSNTQARAALVTDHPDYRGFVYAHELGHNLGRLHAPCGGPSDPDAGFPYPGGIIGAWGLHLPGLIPKHPGATHDIMGYCEPKWVSPYTWGRILDWRAAAPSVMATPVAQGGAEDGLVVWGRLTPDGLILEPAFRSVPTAQGAPQPGSWLVEGFDRAGMLLFRQPFAPMEVPHLPGGREEHFAMVLPLGAARADRIARLRVSSPLHVVERVSGWTPAVVEPDAEVRAMQAGARRVTWREERYPMVIVRDAASGEILGFGRGGALDVLSGAARLDLQFSDGVSGRGVRRIAAVR